MLLLYAAHLLAGSLLSVGGTELVFGLQAIAGGGTRFGMPPYVFFVFGLIVALGGIGDLRMMRSGPPVGARRLARVHGRRVQPQEATS